MGWKTWLLAMALWALFEGLLPCLCPGFYLRCLRRVGEKATPAGIRLTGVALVVFAIALLWLAKLA